MKKIPCEIYSRVVGYFRPVQQWNKSKQEEFKDRKPFDLLQIEEVENDTAERRNKAS